MSHEEQEEFDCDVRQIDWIAYLNNTVKGIQIYLLKQDTLLEKHNMQ